MNYRLVIGKIEKDWNDNLKEKYMGRTETIRLDIPSIEIAHQIAKLTNLNSYLIIKSEDEWEREPVFTTPDIKAWHEKQQNERDEERKKLTAQCERINKTPITYQYGEVAGYKIIFKRSEASYNPARASRVLWDLSIYFIINEHEEWFNIDRFRSSNGKRLHNRFNDYFKYMIENKELRESLWNEIPKIEAKYKEIKNQILNA